MSEPVYVVAGAVRIQSWIARTPLLRLSRGASRALAAETGATTLDASLTVSSIRAVRAADAPDVDGVVVLRVDATRDTAESVGEAVDWLRQQLGGKLPGVEWQLWAHRAPTYVQAYQTVMHGGVASHGRWHLPPAEIDFPAATACDGCNVEAAVGVAQVVDDALSLGPDCLVRLAHTRGDSDQRAWTFDALAKCGGVGSGGTDSSRVIGRRDAANHLATIAADGNQVGVLFSRLASLPATTYTFDGKPTTVQERISRQLAAATREAVHNASQVGDQGAELRCAIDHLIGGDDVLVSVGARFAWTYVQSLMDDFAEQFGRAVESVLAQAVGVGAIEEASANGLRALTGKISLGVGMVFANRTHPFAHTAELAHQALEAAKRAGRGGAAVSWLDITVDSPGDVNRVVSSEDLLDPQQTPKAFDLNASARATLSGLIRDGRRSRRKLATADPAGDSADQEQSVAEIAEVVRAWCTRTGRPELLAEHAGSVELSRLDDDLDRTRWWPDLAVEELTL